MKTDIKHKILRMHLINNLMKDIHSIEINEKYKHLIINESQTFFYNKESELNNDYHLMMANYDNR